MQDRPSSDTRCGVRKHHRDWSQSRPAGTKYCLCDPAFERMTGWMADEIVGKSPRLLQGVKTDHSVFEDMRDALRRGDRWEGQAVNYRKNGAEFVMEWSITPLKDASGRTTHFVAVQRDVTARGGRAPYRRSAWAARERIGRRLTWRAISRPRWSRSSLRPIGRGRVRRQEIAVMFIDIVGFTALSEMLTNASSRL